jgi:hypothetical protein
MYFKTRLFNSTQNLQIQCKIYSSVALLLVTCVFNPMIVAASDWAGDEKSNGFNRQTVTSTTTGLIWEVCFCSGFQYYAAVTPDGTSRSIVHDVVGPLFWLVCTCAIYSCLLSITKFSKAAKFCDKLTDNQTLFQHGVDPKRSQGDLNKLCSTRGSLNIRVVRLI